MENRKYTSPVLFHYLSSEVWRPFPCRISYYLQRSSIRLKNNNIALHNMTIYLHMCCICFLENKRYSPDHSVCILKRMSRDEILRNPAQSFYKHLFDETDSLHFSFLKKASDWEECYSTYSSPTLFIILLKYSKKNF